MKKKTVFTLTLIALSAMLIGACAPLETVAAQVAPVESNFQSQQAANTPSENTQGYGGQGNNGQGQQGDCESNQMLVAAGELTESDIESLLYMREEEKLARDVYLTLYDQWGLQIFQNIASSEQKHTDSVKGLLDLYEIADPVTDDSIGAFTNSDLQVLYDQLVVTGSASLADALKVGAAIEEIDILDLQESLAQTADPNITMIYSNLLAGSGNHLRAFVSQIQGQTGETYQPQYMSLDGYNAIISAASGHGNGQGGSGQGKGGGRGRN